MWKVYLGWVSQSTSIRILIQPQHVHPETKGLQNEPVLRQIRKTTETPPPPPSEFHGAQSGGHLAASSAITAGQSQDALS